MRSRRPLRRVRATLTAAVLAVGALGCAGGGSGSGATTIPAAVGAPVPSVAPTTAAIDESGTFSVSAVDAVLVDPSRPTVANRSAPAKPDRTLPTLVLHPTTGDGPFPLVVFSHGIGGNGPAYRRTLEDVASAGYVVAAPTYPLSNDTTPGGAVLTDVAEQTRDIAFLIEQLTATGGAGNPLPPDVVDGERIGVFGHSLGGITTLGAAYSECCALPEVDAAVEWAGLLFGLEGEATVDPADDGPPLLIVHGDADNVVAYSNADQVLAAVQAPRTLVTIAGGDHIAPYLTGLEESASGVTTGVTLAFFDTHLKGDRTGADRLAQVVEDSEGLASIRDETSS